MATSFQSWLRSKLRRGHGAATKNSLTSDFICGCEARLREKETSPDTSAPPKYEGHGSDPLARMTPILIKDLKVCLRLSDEPSIQQIADFIAEHAREQLTLRGYNSTSTATIAAAIRDGSLSAAVAVKKTFVTTTRCRLNDDVDEGCQKAVRAVIAAAAAAPVKGILGIATGTASYIALAGNIVAYQNKKKGDGTARAAATLLESEVHHMAATISIRHVAGILVLSEIHVPPRYEFLPGS